MITVLIFLIACRKEHVSNDICDCADSQSTYVIDTITLTIPNIFTPNGDCLNDYWVIKNIDKFPDSKIKLTRPGILGGIVYESTGNNLYWNGEKDDKRGLKEGKYKYEIAIKGKAINGFVCIYRGSTNLENQDCIKRCVTIDMHDPLISN